MLQSETKNPFQQQKLPPEKKRNRLFATVPELLLASIPVKTKLLSSAKFLYYLSLNSQDLWNFVLGFLLWCACGIDVHVLCIN